MLHDHHSLETLLLAQAEPEILIITLNRPTVLNAINSVMMRELYALWGFLRFNYGKFRCIILTGMGERAFCSGADLKERQSLSVTTWQEQHAWLQQAMLAMVDCPIPVIAAINGIAFGGGLELAMACDFAYATNHAVFAQSETRLGIMPGAMGTQHLPRAIGMRRAKELCFTASQFDAETAYQYGLINRICAQTELMNETLRTAQTICQNAPIAVRQAKKSLNMSAHLDIKSGYAYEVEAYSRLLPTEDRKEGIQAFHDKRAPVFRNC